MIREIRPHVLVTYDEYGGYGHPDHIQAHRVATYGAALAAVPSYKIHLGAAWDIPKIYWNALPRSVLEDMTPRSAAEEDLTSSKARMPMTSALSCPTRPLRLRSTARFSSSASWLRCGRMRPR